MKYKYEKYGRGFSCVGATGGSGSGGGGAVGSGVQAADGGGLRKFNLDNDNQVNNNKLTTC